SHIAIAENRQNRPELLFDHETRGVRDVADDRRSYEIAFPLQRFAPGDNNAVSLRVFKVTFDFFELRLVLQRPHLGALPEAVTYNIFPRKPAQFVAHLVVTGIMDVETLDRETDLTGEHGGAGKDLRCDLLRIDVVEHDGGIITAKLQC